MPGSISPEDICSTEAMESFFFFKHWQKSIFHKCNIVLLFYHKQVSYMREKNPTEINYLLTRQELESFTIQIQMLPRTVSIVK